MRIFTKFLSFILLFLFFLSLPGNELQTQTNLAGKYLSGIVDFDNLQKNSTLTIDIFYIDITNFPDSVYIYCIVKDNFGNHVKGLAPPYNAANRSKWKKVVEKFSDKEIVINDFEVEEIRQSESPGFISSFVLDYSGSMWGQIHNVESAIMKVKNYIRPNIDYYDIIQFDHRIFNPVKNSKDPNELSKILPFSSLGGATAFYSASVFGIDNLVKGLPKTKVAILFTDGMDNSSFYANANTVISKARKAGLRVFIIGYGYADRNILTQIAYQTGGKAYFPNDLSELDNIFNEIYQQMKVYYVIKYKPAKNDSNIVQVSIDMAEVNGNKVNCNSSVYYPVPVPLPVSLTNILALFKTGSAVLEDYYLPLIKGFADYCKQNPGLRFSLVGHSDGTGNMKTQTDLSLRRVHAVYDILVNNGVNVDQIVDILGKGNDEPIHKKEQHDWQRTENNRVEVIFK